MPETKILIVEDEAIEALDLQQRLTSLGYPAPEIVFSGEEALKKAEEIRPDLVLMDIMLSGEIDGVTAAEKIKAQFDIPIIYLTAYADEDTLQRAKITEPYGYIVKPFKERELHIMIDVALYKHNMEKKLKENEKWLATTLRSIGDGVIATDKEGLITFMNGVAESLMGWSLEEIVRKPLAQVFNIINRDTRLPVENPVTRVIDEGTIGGLANHTILMARDGREIPIDDSAAPIKDDQGNIIGVVLIFRDVTEREKALQVLHGYQKELEQRVAEKTRDLQKINEQLQQEIKERKEMEGEKEKLQAQILQSQKMEAIGVLAAGVAHDFNNLLTAVIGHTSLALLKVDEADPLVRELEAIRRAADQAANLTRQLLIFSRKQSVEFAPIDLNKGIANLLHMLHRLIGEDITLTFESAPDLYSVFADEGNIEQVIMNLAVNARDAMPKGGKLTIKTEKVTLDEEQAERIPQGRAGRFVRLSITDTGCGMDEETREKIFEPFFTTKGVGRGTGLGLAVVYGIVGQHQGWIEVESEPGRGTAFFIYLPAFSGQAGEKSSEIPSLKHLQGNGERILIVEDEQVVITLLKKVLQENGYRVSCTRCVHEAIDRFLKERDGFDLVISDVVLPDQNGIELIDQLGQHNSGLKVLLISGYTDQKSQWPYIQERGIPFLPKPFAPPDLLGMVRNLFTMRGT
ncbi:MAG: response regulator [bacterium]